VSDRNFYSLLDLSFERAGECPAFRAPNGRIVLSYRQLRDQVAQYANALSVLGALPGERVTVQVEKSIENVLLYLAVLKCGAVYQPLNPAYTEAEVEYFVGDAEPAIVICDPAKQGFMRELGDRKKVTAVVNLSATGQGSLPELAAKMDTHHVMVPRHGDDLAGLLYTSGTTGRSKGAMLSHDNLSSNAQTLRKLWAFSSKDVLLHGLPIFHVHGLYVALNTSFLAGCQIIWFDKFDAAQVIEALPKASVMMGVPAMYTRLLASPRLNRQACRNMRLFIAGSAPLLAATHADFKERTGHDILERYGMTETGMLTSNPYDGPRLPGTAGFPLPDVSLRIADGQGREVPRGETGGIEVKGPNVFKGYWRLPEKTREEFRDDGYFITGDIGTMDDEGRVTISGRAKDLVISGGYNVYPKEIEEQLDALPGVEESAVIGVPHPDFGEGVVAILAKKGDVLSEQGMIAALSSKLAKFKLPKRIFVLDQLPRNAMGKVQKAELRRRFADTFTKT
jgi:malonyl-CoA/methylmalonyl-CoA synthetase